VVAVVCNHFELKEQPMLDAGHPDLSEFLATSSHKQIGLVRKAAIALLRRPLLTQPIMSSFDAVKDYLYAQYASATHEHFHVLYLDRKNRLINDECIATGTVDHVPVYPCEVMRSAILQNASALILAHNHPSGETTPSTSDITMTQQLYQAAETLGIVLHDHLIVGRSSVYSMKSNGDF
jgi:DNA repair protein RadC